MTATVAVSTAIEIMRARPSRAPQAATRVSPARVSPAPTSSPGAYGQRGLRGLRLTRRGRAVVLALALTVSIPAVGFGGRAVASDPGVPIEVSVHTVAPGETLWGFARELAAPGQDVREVVAQLRDLNELRSTGLKVGQTLLLPKH